MRSTRKTAGLPNAAARTAHIVRPRIYIAPDFSLGPGKIDLLCAIARTGSIAAAARALGMSYKRAWFLIDNVSAGLGAPVVRTATGGRGGGGARLSPRGEALVRLYQAVERACADAAGRELAALLEVYRRSRARSRPGRRRPRR